MVRSGKVIVLGGVHGNEIAGIEVLDRVKDKVDTLLCNPKAVEKNVRFVEEDLNRLFGVENDSYEGNLAKEIKKKLNQYDICIDIHNSTSKETEPFVICEKNCLEVVKKIPVKKVVLGFSKFEKGTDYYMNRNGKIGICIECGNFEDERSVDFAEKCVNSIFEEATYEQELFELVESYEKPFETPGFRDFSYVDGVIGYSDGQPIVRKGYVLFVGKNGFRLAKKL